MKKNTYILKMSILLLEEVVDHLKSLVVISGNGKNSELRRQHAEHVARRKKPLYKYAMVLLKTRFVHFY